MAVRAGPARAKIFPPHPGFALPRNPGGAARNAVRAIGPVPWYAGNAAVTIEKNEGRSALLVEGFPWEVGS